MKKRRRIELSLRLEEARATLEAVADVLELVKMNGWVDSGDRTGDWVRRLERCARKLRAGIRYVTEDNPTLEGR